MHQIEYEKVFEIYRTNWYNTIFKPKKILIIKKFLIDMTENCSMNVVKSLSY